ncbi:MAG: putative bifunctional diguanylate cyclase/phosphodiesterase, partial [Aestuariivirgaceae bacterium]
LSASCGLAAYPQSANSADLLTARAYCALNEAKASERTSISLFDPEHENTIQHRSQVEQALRRALHNQDLEVVYQPIVDLTTLRPVAFEALARWKDQDLGEVSPDVFVPIAEQTGLINELTFQLLDEASAAANQWPKDVHLSFNMSAKEVVKTSTGLRTLSVLNKNMLPPQRLDIEITESAFIENLEAAIANIQNLKLSGISVALDDFGTGHASLGYVEKIALDKLKIDRSFITSINEKERSQYIVKAIIEMCRNLEIRCIAEGIETHDELSALRALGCKYGQGFLFARPMTEDQTLQYLAAEKFAIPLNQRRLVG